MAIRPGAGEAEDGSAVRKQVVIQQRDHDRRARCVGSRLGARGWITRRGGRRKDAQAEPLVRTVGDLEAPVEDRYKLARLCGKHEAATQKRNATDARRREDSMKTSL